jgi:protocatechuate 3,4-dioxygenase beta subunit
MPRMISVAQKHLLVYILGLFHLVSSVQGLAEVGCNPVTGATQFTAVDDGDFFYIPNAPIRSRLAPENQLADPAYRLFVQGQIWGSDCAPIKDAVIEIWYAGKPDENGNYYSVAGSDLNYRGTLMADDCGYYSYTQSIPEQFVGSRHINFQVSSPDGGILLTTQIFFQGFIAANQRVPTSQIVPVNQEADGSFGIVFDVYIETPGTASESCISVTEATEGKQPMGTVFVDVAICYCRGCEWPNLLLFQCNKGPSLTNGWGNATEDPSMEGSDSTMSPSLILAEETEITSSPTEPPTTLSPTLPPSSPRPTTAAPTNSPTQLVIPPNDLCFNAIGPLPTTPRSVDGSLEILTAGTTVGATSQLLDRCGGITITSPSVWYYTIGNGGILTASTCWPGTNLDTKITVFTGNCTVPTCVAANDDAGSSLRGACDVNNLASRISWNSELNKVYWIMVHAFSKRTGNFEINIEANNDMCQFAVPMAPGDSIKGDNRGAQAPFGGEIDNCGGTGLIGEGGALWYKVIGTGATLEASTCNEGTGYLDTKIHVFEGSCDIDSCIGGHSPQRTCGRYQWASTAGVEYFILVHSYQPAAGLFELSVNEVISK